MNYALNKLDKLLVIVESPNKVKTLTSILTKAGYVNTTVMASVGHIMVLGDGGPAYNSGVYPKKQFKMNLTVPAEKQKIVNSIIAQAKSADKIVLATDKDREGELISWSLIKFCELPLDKCLRVAFHEITPNAVIKALENPVPFDDNLVNAGLVRMMSDKLIGYGLSPLGKKYIGAKSIGRCQSVGLKLISDRETEILNFIPELYFSLYLSFIKNGISYRAKYVGYNNEQIEKFNKQADVDAAINNCSNTTFYIESINKSTHHESPKPPFCTATFQQEAANKLGLRVKDAMSYAQKLFEGININGEHVGLITYMRTDSTEMSEDFLPVLMDFVRNTYGNDKYTGPRKRKKKAGSQDGHEALRVVDPTITPEYLSKFVSNNLLVKVYRLIWQRTVAAVLPSALITETEYYINGNGHKFCFSTKTLESCGYRVAYDFCEVSDFIKSDNDFYVNEELQDTTLITDKKFTKPKARYTEASLVSELERREIGRPSTYATIVDTILSTTRGYATLEDKYIVPTDRGMQLAEYCNRAFPTLINLDYTKNMESCLDKIASGDTQWLDYMEAFYVDLQEVINKTSETGIAAELPIKQCPSCNSDMIVRRSRFGKLFYGCSAYPKCKITTNID